MGDHRANDRAAPPAIWVLGGDKLGDNSQLLRAVSAMGLPYEYKTITLKPGAEKHRLAIRPSIAHVDPALSCKLEAPWPDLVVTVGRHLSCVALWVKQQSGGHSKIALFNAPRGRHADFDLILVPSLYEVADGPNVLRYQFPLTALDPQSIEQAAALSRPTDGPLHVLLLGGPTRDLTLDAETALAILNSMREGHARGGRIQIVTSRRTPPAVVDQLEGQLRPGEALYRWKANDKANPYRALLAHGDTFTVTGDSLSMLIDVASLGKTLVIAPCPARVQPCNGWPGRWPPFPPHSPASCRVCRCRWRSSGTTTSSTSCWCARAMRWNWATRPRRPRHPSPMNHNASPRP